MSKKRRNKFGKSPAQTGEACGQGKGTQKISLLGRIFKFLALGVIWGGLAVALLVAYYAETLPDIKDVVQPTRRPSVTLLSSDGAVFARYGDLTGERVTLNDVPKQLVQAIISIEDRRFYHHMGIDLLGMGRAMLRNVLAGHLVQGGSTLTQQLAKNLFLSSERTLRRKVQEVLLALWLERTYTKDQILTAYLNRVYLGSGTYGVAAASEIYFGKSVKELNLRECAILAGLLRAPSRYAPTNDMDEAMARAEVVLSTMIEAGYITEKDKQAALDDQHLPRQKPGAGGDGRYFADWISEQVSGMVANTQQDLIVQTTLDFKLQRAAERQVNAVLSAAAERNVGQAALVTLAPDGAVKAMVGGNDYNSSQFNRAVLAQRQPGSSFKPVIYLSAIEQGLSPSDNFVDEPLTIGDWSPANYDNKFRGTVSVRQALAESINTVAIRVLQKYGINYAIEAARAIGITSKLEPELSLALGTNIVNPLELTGVYAALASGGRAITPYAITEIRSRAGQVLYRYTPVNPPVTVQPKAVATLVDMMTEVVRSGTGKKAMLDRPVAGKTGTSSDYRDAWFLGFTADYTTGVWLGNDDNQPMDKVTGGSFPAQLWHDYMVEAEVGLPPRNLLPNLPASATLHGNANDNTSGSATDHQDFIGGLIGDLMGSKTESSPTQRR